MELITYLLLLALSGLIVGALGRLLVPGRDPLTIPQTILVGIGGSLIAGVVAWYVLGQGNNVGLGFILAVLFSAGIVYLLGRSGRRRGGLL